VVEWIARHSDAISALTSGGMLVVWLVYLQVFINSYRRSLRATLVIARGPGKGLSARCFVANMSSGAIYISSVQVRLSLEGEEITSAVTNIDTQDGGTKQGPLADGECRDIGSFEDLIGHAFLAASREPGPVASVTIEVVGIYGSEDLPVGARRTFDVRREESTAFVRGENIRTEQIRRKRDRRKLVDDLERDH
jgi:hypothetical protein